jgi:hypothetical protein
MSQAGQKLLIDVVLQALLATLEMVFYFPAALSCLRLIFYSDDTENKICTSPRI